MANAGFIYAPTDDSDDNVQCPYCETALDGWEIEDDPVHEHQRRRPNCPFFATRAAAPTKASAAKAAKQKRKPLDVDGEEAESDSNLVSFLVTASGFVQLLASLKVYFYIKSGR